jgi:hypothetical protein
MTSASHNEGGEDFSGVGAEETSEDRDRVRVRRAGE